MTKHTAVAGIMACVLFAAALAKDDEAKKETKGTPHKSTLVQEVVVTASRADEDAPATFTNISREQLEQAYDAQDIPALLRMTPSVYAYSDAGNDLGYSYLRVRGFDQARLAVTINGVPLNDAESHQVYWIDLPNFPDSIEDLQVQRGAGTSVYGGNAIGGTVNLETARLRPGAGSVVSVGLASFGTGKLSAAWTSDLFAERWVFAARVSHIETDGYRDQSWAKLDSAFFTAQRMGRRSLLRINLYGGREETHLAYEGLTRKQLAENRRQNPLRWKGEIDHFTQPHFEVIHEFRPSEKIEIANTLYSFYGEGYFDQFRERKRFAEVRLPEWDWDGDGTVDRKGPIFRRRQVREWDFGWSPRVSYRHGAGTLTVGASLRMHRGKHTGRVSGALPPGTPKGFHYYAYEVPKTTSVLYAQEEWQLTPALRLVGGLQYVDHSFKLEKDRVTGLSYDLSYSWIAPRVALSARISPRLSTFFSLAHSRREPGVKDLFDPSDIYAPPAFARKDADGTLHGPLVEEEKLDDYELGVAFTSEHLVLKATLYDMEFRDELVYLGQRNDLGEAVTGNADRSVHRGIELEWAAQLSSAISLSGHAMFSDDRLTDFVLPVFDWGSGEFVEVDYSGNRIAYFPNLLARASLAWELFWGRVALGVAHTGRVYLDNSQTRNMSIDPFQVLDLSARLDFASKRQRAYALHLRVENLLDKEYEAFGYSDWGTPVFIPAATRHLFLMLSYKQRP